MSEYEFDRVLPPGASQSDVYAAAVKPIVEDVLAGAAERACLVSLGRVVDLALGGAVSDGCVHAQQYRSARACALHLSLDSGPLAPALHQAQATMAP